MTAIRGAAAAVTGTASGIGRALALELAARGCDLALADRDEAGLQAVAAEIGKVHSANVTVHRVDVAKSSEIEAFAQAASGRHPGLNIVVNNAGVALLGRFSEIDQAQMEWLININFWGVVHSTRAFLPQLARQREAHIVNLSSIFGIIAPPGQTAYAASKFAVRGFSESLRHELQAAASPVRVSVVHPGGVATNIVRNSRTGVGVTDNERRAGAIERFDSVARTTPAAAALRIIKGIENNEPRILIGSDARMMDLLQRFLRAMSGSCQTRTHAPQQKTSLFDHIIGERQQVRWNIETKRPRGLKVDCDFEFYRRLCRQIGRAGSLQNAIDVGSRALEYVDRISPVRHQAAFLNVLPVGVGRGNAVLPGRPDDRAAMNNHVRIGGNEERAARLPSELRDNFVDFLRTTYLRRGQLQRQGSCNRLERLQMDGVIRVGVRVEHDGDANDPGRDLLEHLQRLSDHRIFKERKAGDIAARVRHATVLRLMTNSYFVAPEPVGRPASRL